MHFICKFAVALGASPCCEAASWLTAGADAPAEGFFFGSGVVAACAIAKGRKAAIDKSEKKRRTMKLRSFKGACRILSQLVSLNMAFNQIS